MYRKTHRRLKPYATGFAALVCLALSHAPAFARDEDLEEIIVTGTRIARRDFESASPIVSVTQELFERTGSITVETTLNTLPQFVPAYTNTSNLASNGGQANVQLRGLGSTSTLVLIDGKRLIPANGNGVVDLNIIPGSLIESVEIITGGASAVYGSDALAGVVNFRLKEEFDGLELDAQWGQTEQGDGAEYGGGFTAGLDFADGRGSVLGYVGYAERETVLSTQRDFARYVLGYVGPDTGGVGPGGAFLPFGAPRLEEGRVVDVSPQRGRVRELVYLLRLSGTLRSEADGVWRQCRWHGIHAGHFRSGIGTQFPRRARPVLVQRSFLYPQRRGLRLATAPGAPVGIRARESRVQRYDRAVCARLVRRLHRGPADRSGRDVRQRADAADESVHSAGPATAARLASLSRTRTSCSTSS